MHIRTHTQTRTSLTALAALALAACAPDQATTAPHGDPSLARGPGGEHGSGKRAAGAVYSMSNDPRRNTVVAFNRDADGKLRPAGTYETGGTGSGAFEDAANGVVLGDRNGEAAPNNLTDATQLLFVVNAGSNSISVFRVNQDDAANGKKDALQLVAVQPSGGEKPVSLTVNRGLLYVLHSGETVDGEIATPNCTTGDLPSITGFRVSAAGQLTPIPGSTRRLSGDPHSGCAQVSFTPDGRVLVVTERLARDEDPSGPAGDEGVIDTYVVNADGTPGAARVSDATGQGPFGFTFTKAGALLTTEQFDGPMGVGLGAAAGYTLGASGALTAASGSVRNGGTDTCWFVVTDDGRHGYATSFFEGGRISLYRVGASGSLALLDGTADRGTAGTGASDMALSLASDYLYQLNSFEGTINEYRVGATGALTLVQTVHAHAPSKTAAPMGLAAR
jgi:6-phosphogluconolactonase (cycloisomerase 2 family)